MELYHDEYSTYYHYDDSYQEDEFGESMDETREEFSKVSEDVIELSDSEGEGDGGQKLSNGDCNHAPKSDLNGDSTLNSSEDFIIVQPDQLNDSSDDYDEDDFEEENDVRPNPADLGLTFIEDDEEISSTNCNQVGSVNLENNDGTYRCPLCPKEVVSKYNLKRHMMIHTGEKPYKCEICYKGFREQSDLRKHKKVHIFGNRLFKCNVCFRSYQSYKSNKCYFCEGDDDDIPNGYEDPTKRFNCFLCNKTELSTAELKAHLRNDHPATSRVPYSGGAGSSNVQLVSRSVEDMEKIHKCNVCSKAFRSKQFLMLHTLTHANNRIDHVLS